MTRKLYIYKMKTTFICPVCKRSASRNVTNLIEIEQKIQLKCNCACGFSDTALLERRRYTRKAVLLPGIYNRFCFDRITEKGSIVLTDLSCSGLRFTPNNKKTFRIGEMIRIVFNLDDDNKSLIRKKAVVRNIDSRQHVGIAFCNTDIAGRIGSYLFT